MDEPLAALTRGDLAAARQLRRALGVLAEAMTPEERARADREAATVEEWAALEERTDD